MKKVFYTYRIHGTIEVPDDATDEEVERLILSGLSDGYVCDGTLDWEEIEGDIKNGSDSRDSTHLVG